MLCDHCLVCQASCCLAPSPSLTMKTLVSLHSVTHTVTQSTFKKKLHLELCLSPTQLEALLSASNGGGGSLKCQSVGA